MTGPSHVRTVGGETSSVPARHPPVRPHRPTPQIRCRVRRDSTFRKLQEGQNGCRSRQVSFARSAGAPLRDRGMIAKFLLPFLAMAMLVFAVAHVFRSRPDMAVADPPFPPSVPAQEQVLSATGIVEAKSANVAVASAVPGVVAFVFVSAGQPVKEKDPLFRLDDTALKAARKVREAQRETAQARLNRLISPPRSEELLASAARVRAARADLAAKRAAHEHASKLAADSLISATELEQRKQAVAAAQAQLDQAEAEDRLLRAGASAADVAVAKAQVAEAEALVAQAAAELERLTTRAPIAGTVLQLNVRKGEAVGGQLDQPPVVLGDTSTLHLRVDLDEQLLTRFRPD